MNRSRSSRNRLGTSPDPASRDPPRSTSRVPRRVRSPGLGQCDAFCTQESAGSHFCSRDYKLFIDPWFTLQNKCNSMSRSGSLILHCSPCQIPYSFHPILPPANLPMPTTTVSSTNQPATVPSQSEDQPRPQLPLKNKWPRFKAKVRSYQSLGESTMNPSQITRAG